MVMSVNSQRSQDRILTQHNKLHRVTSKEKQRRHKLKGLGDKIAREHKKVTGKTEHGVSRHKNNKVDGVHKRFKTNTADGCSHSLTPFIPWINWASHRDASSLLRKGRP